MPFGMTAWTPQTGEYGWIYQYQKDRFQGFRATHQPSPWMGDYGQFSFMPMTAELKIEDEERGALFSHTDEESRPYYYRVKLQENGITGELTPTMRSAVMRFHFPAGEPAYLLLDASQGGRQHRDPAGTTRDPWLYSHQFRRRTGQFCLLFLLRRSIRHLIPTVRQAARKYRKRKSSQAGRDVSAYLQFSGEEAQTVNVRVSTSFISLEQAALNLEQEIGNKDFERVKQEAKTGWEQEMQKIRLEGATEAQLITFYTAFYRALLFPRVWHEFDSEGEMVHFSPYDGQIHPGEMYADNGFWDTFRAVFSLLYAYVSGAGRGNYSRLDQCLPRRRLVSPSGPAPAIVTS